MAKENGNNKKSNELSSFLNTSDLASSIENEICREINEIHTENTNGNINNSNVNGGTPEPPKREENPFSLKHFLKRDVPSVNNSNNSNINIHTVSCSTNKINSPVSGMLNHQISYQNTTGARPKTTQQSINEATKMKRSPRFPSFDSHLNSSEYTDDNLSMTNLFHSRSNTSFNTSEYSPHNETSSFVQRSYSNYDMESPRTSPRMDRRKERITNLNRSNSGRLGNSEFSSALPDFVQDHLVVEQLYNAFGSPPASTSPLSLDVEQSPDFGNDNLEFELISRVPEVVNCNNDMPFDLTFNSTASGRCRTPLRRNSPTVVPLDLPSRSDLPMHHRRDGRHPLSADLTLDLTGTSNEARGFIFPGGEYQSCDKIQTLPDFLSDGPILHSSGRLADVAQDLPHLPHSPDDDSIGSIMARLRLENERLRLELDESRRVLGERTRRVTELERTLESERCNESQYNATLAHSMEQVEENLDRSNKRAALAQSHVTKLKQQVQQLTTEVDSLRRENESLKEEGAVGGGGGSGGGGGVGNTNGNRTYHRPLRTQQLSRELLLAASNAESNLRQLLTGVDNLRVMAATIENMDRIVDQNDEFLSGCDEEDFTGPAL